MLFSPVGSSRLQRIQGAYIDEPQIAQADRPVASSGRARAARGAARGGRARDAGAALATSFDPDEDPLLTDAIRWSSRCRPPRRRCSSAACASGYTRAGRMIDMLERRGVISGYEGSKPRQVLITEADLPRVLAGLESRSAQAVGSEPAAPAISDYGCRQEIFDRRGRPFRGAVRHPRCSPCHQHVCARVRRLPSTARTSEPAAYFLANP